MSDESPTTPYTAARSAAEVSARLIEIYGVDPARAAGVIHVVATARAPDGLLHALRIGPHAPKSETDFFLLQAVRARADGILTTSANLRAEPHLIHDFVGESAAGLAEYRRQTAQRTGPLHVFVLTQSGDLPRDHPVWRDGARKHVLVPPESVTRVRSRVPPETIVHPVDDLSIRSAVALAQGLGHRTLSLEAGPTLAFACYGEGAIVDELCLSIYTGPALAPEALVAALPPDAVLFRDRVLSAPPAQVADWVFYRYL